MSFSSYTAPWVYKTVFHVSSLHEKFMEPGEIFVVKFPVQIGPDFYSFVSMILINIFSILTILFMAVRCYPFGD